MNDMDQKIREALSKEDSDLIMAAKNEAGVFELMLSTFRGRNKFFAVIANLFIFAFLFLAVFSVYRFVGSVEQRDMLMWLAIAGASFLAIGNLKIWFWMEMNKNAVLREVKRVELQVARLIAQQEK